MRSGTSICLNWLTQMVTTRLRHPVASKNVNKVKLTKNFKRRVCLDVVHSCPLFSSLAFV